MSVRTPPPPLHLRRRHLYLLHLRGLLCRLLLALLLETDKQRDAHDGQAQANAHPHPDLNFLLGNGLG